MVFGYDNGNEGYGNEGYGDKESTGGFTYDVMDIFVEGACALAPNSILFAERYTLTQATHIFEVGYWDAAYFTINCFNNRFSTFSEKLCKLEHTHPASSRPKSFESNPSRQSRFPGLYERPQIPPAQVFRPIMAALLKSVDLAAMEGSLVDVKREMRTYIGERRWWGDQSQASNPTATPPVLYTLDLLILMHEISDILNVRWYMGAPFNDTSNLKLQIMEHGQAILGDYLLGMQVGNELDLFSVGGRARSVNYTINDYIGEVHQFIAGVNADTAITNKSMLIGPSVSGNGAFTEQNVFDAGISATGSNQYKIR
ncbi:hypothetical protein C8J56DRAFT_889536 [Mycena floridula]|nr:hypothetical protein C8J56DRAFT_889536 [Mycena floridula]